MWTPVKGFDPLLNRLHRLGYNVGPNARDPDAPPGNLLLVPYDWRLSTGSTVATSPSRSNLP